MNKYLCPRCPKEYQSRNDLIRHLKRIHGIVDVMSQLDIIEVVARAEAGG